MLYNIIMICKIKGCRKSGRYSINIYCRNHQRLIDLYGKPEYNPNWCGSKNGSFNNYGYWRITINGKRVLEHRYVIEQYLGRSLKFNEKVHHLNGIRNDNRLENLELVSNQSEHIHNYHNKIWQKRKINNTSVDWRKYSIPNKDYLHDERRKCIVDSCIIPERTRQLCNKHYIAYRRFIGR